MARPPLLSQEGNTLSKHFKLRHYPRSASATARSLRDDRRRCRKMVSFPHMSTQSVELAYGQGQLSVDVPASNLLGIYIPLPASVTADQKSLVAAAMARPIGKPSLREVVRPGQQIAILTSDL